MTARTLETSIEIGSNEYEFEIEFDWEPVDHGNAIGPVEACRPPSGGFGGITRVLRWAGADASLGIVMPLQFCLDIFDELDLRDDIEQRCIDAALEEDGDQ